MTNPPAKPGHDGAPGPWLVRIPEVFAREGAALIRRWSPSGEVPLGSEFHLLRSASAAGLGGVEAGLFTTWRMPVEHSWPCRPRTMEGFVEKAAQGLARRFGDRPPVAIRVGLLQTGTPNTYYRKLASNLRGRALQVMPAREGGSADAPGPDDPVLFCLLGPEGLYAGVATPRAAGAPVAGGWRPMAQPEDSSISRAGAKIEEALEALRLHRNPPRPGAHWLELGASPGGMTRALLAKGYRVTAVDRAPLDHRLDRATGLVFHRVDAPVFRPRPGEWFDALLCDLNGDPRAALEAVVRQATALRAGAPVVFTLKLAGADSVESIVALRNTIAARARDAGLASVAHVHLPSNRREFTLLLEAAPRRAPEAKARS